jgi:hypothetical protein
MTTDYTYTSIYHVLTLTHMFQLYLLVYHCQIMEVSPNNHALFTAESYVDTELAGLHLRTFSGRCGRSASESALAGDGVSGCGFRQVGEDHVKNQEWTSPTNCIGTIWLFDIAMENP